MKRMFAFATALLLASPAHAVDVSVGAALTGNLRISNPGGGAEFVNPVSESTSALGFGAGLVVPVRIHVNELAAVRLSTHVHYAQGAVGFTKGNQNYRYFGSSLLVGEAIGGEMALAAEGGVRPYLFGEIGGGLLTMWPRSAEGANPPMTDPELCELRDVSEEACVQGISSSEEIRTAAPTALVNLGLGIAAGDVMRVELGYLRGRLGENAAVNQAQDDVTLIETAYQAVQLTVGVAFGGP